MKNRRTFGNCACSNLSFLSREGLTLVLVALATTALLVVTMRAVNADGSDNSTKIEGQLAGAMLNGLVPKGEAEFESLADGSRQFEVEVNNVNLPDGTVLNVSVDGTKVGTLTLIGHQGELELKTKDGQTLPEINSRTRVVISDQAGNTILAGSFSNIPPSPSPTGSPTGTPTATPTATPSATPTATPSATPAANALQAPLSGPAIGGVTPKGEADFQAFSDGSRRLDVEVEDVNLGDGTMLNVLIDGSQVGTLTLMGHRAELELKTRDGQTVPPIVAGSQVMVTDQAGHTILSGTFAVIPLPTPSPTATPVGSPTPTPTPNPNAAVRLESRLAGAAINNLTPKGHAKFLMRPDGRSKLNVEIEKVNLPAGTMLNVMIDNTGVGQITLGQGLEGELELDTQKGNTVPSVNTGSTIVITNAQNATILSGVFNTVRNDVAGNDIDDDSIFVEQQYNDFLDREGDDNGLDFWKQQIAGCGNDAACRERARINTSGAFFLSIEFQDTGYLLYRMNKASFGSMPRRNDFLVEMQAVAQGVVVNSPGWQQKLEDNKQQEAERFARRQDFRDQFDDKSNRDFVNALFANAGVADDPNEVEDLVRGLDSGSASRGAVLRKVAEDSAFAEKEKNSAFVLMQYFGYLHRNPDEGQDHDLSGFNFWLGKLNENHGDFQKAEMVKAFLSSTEYRQRFDW
jgi:hypothetical protein